MRAGSGGIGQHGVSNRLENGIRRWRQHAEARSHRGHRAPAPRSNTIEKTAWWEGFPIIGLRTDDQIVDVSIILRGAKSRNAVLHTAYTLSDMPMFSSVYVDHLGRPRALDRLTWLKQQGGSTCGR